MYPYLKFYNRFVGRQIPARPEDEEVAIKCPFHNDTSPSMYINLRTGSWHCKSCDAGVNGGGHIVDWMMEWFDIPMRDALRQKAYWEANNEIKVPIPAQVVWDLHENLLKDEKALSRLIELRGFSLHTIKEYKIGFESAPINRYTFPIIGPRGDIINIRRYRIGEAQAKFINYKDAITCSRLWPLDGEFINSSWVVILEGETDAALGRQHGLPTVTSTGGAGSWPAEVSHYFRGKKVFIVYDPDEAGRQGADRTAMAIREEAEFVRIGTMPIDGDFTDYIMAGNTRDDFQKQVLAKSEIFVPDVEKHLEEDIPMPEEFLPVTLTEATNNPKYNNLGVKLKSMVQGREGMPYSAPKTVKVSCQAYSAEAGKCKGCILANLTTESQREGYDFNFNRTRDMLNYVEASDEKREREIKEAIGIPTKCTSPRMDEIEAYNIETLFIASEVAKFSNNISDEDMNAQTAYHVYESGTTSVRPNRTYEFDAMRTTNPKDGSIVYMILEAKTLRSDIDEFNPSEEDLSALKVFQPKEGQSVKDKMYEIAEDLSYHTRIWGRPDLTIAYDLVYHSVLRFHFQKKLLHRGYVELLAMGDTRTGKTETGSSLVQYYKQGDFIEGENTRLTGLTGTVTQLGGGQWSIVWGKFPQNDRRLLVVDEASGLSKEDWGNLSGMRSRGIVEINKAKSDQAYARTRTIWISNPRAAKHMRDYDYGVRAINDLIGRFEDVARLDFAIGVGKDEINQDIINRDVANLPDSPQMYTADLCQKLVLWSWSRNAKGRISQENDQVIISREAELAILKEAGRLSDLYDESPVNLVERNSMKVKLARLATAVASRLFSTDEEMQNVLVTEEHVSFISEFLEKIYSNMILNYKGLAEEYRRRHTVTDNQQAEIFRFFELNKDTVLGLRKKGTNNWSSQHLVELADIEKEEAVAIISEMHRLDLIYDATQGGVTYRFTHKWNTQVQEWIDKEEDEIAKIIS